MRHVPGIFLSILILIACNSIDEVTPIIGSVDPDDLIKQDTVVILDVSVDPSLQTKYSDDWIFVSNPEGHVLGSKKFESDQSFNMKAYIENNTPEVNVSLLQIIQSGTMTIFNLRSFAHIKRGKQWHISRLIEEKRNSLGKIDIRINNSPRPNVTHYQVSDDFGGQSFSSNYSKGTTTFTINLFESISRIWVTVSTGSNELKFLEINNPVIFGDYSYDYYADFGSPHIEEVISLPQNNYVFATVRGLQDLSYNKKIKSKGLALSEADFRNGRDKVVLGYNYGFPYYYSELTMNTPNYLYHYEKLGDPPVLDGISISVNPITINSNIFSSFDFTGDEGFEHMETTWNWTETINGDENILKWKINSPLDQQPVFLEFPEEILLEYPFLDFDFDRMILETVNLYNNIENYGYEELVEMQIKTNESDYKSYEFEMLSVRD
jgi:hypothetical protein